MKSVNLVFIAVILSGAAYGQQPPDVVASDGDFNTAMGSGSLANLSHGQTPSGEQGYFNTAAGYEALYSNTTGSYNTAVGRYALSNNTTANYNTAFGMGALESNTTGENNTASGLTALVVNTSGNDNTANGFTALGANTIGNDNTASGSLALGLNATGNSNSAFGMNALYSNTSGSYNIASGYDALYANSTADYNIAIGAFALQNSSTGYSNSAVGFAALQNNSVGMNNTALGLYSLNSNVTGNGNIAIGVESGFYTTGSNDIDISNLGSAGESGTIRIGTPGTHSMTYLAGVSTSQITGSAVFVTAGGQLGVLASSERYKTDVRPLTNTKYLQDLRPVTFHLKSDPRGNVQYGLIAEEVVKVYPELVIRDGAGQIDGIRYDELAPMLLSEVQKQAAEIRALKELLAEVHAAVVKLQAKDPLVTKR